MWMRATRHWGTSLACAVCLFACGDDGSLAAQPGARAGGEGEVAGVDSVAGMQPSAGSLAEPSSGSEMQPGGSGTDPSAGSSAEQAGGAGSTGPDATGGAAPADPPAPSTVLDRYRAIGEPFFVEGSGSDNLSGLTWNPDTGTYFGVIDRAGLIHELAPDLGSSLRSIDVVGADLDYEGIAYLGAGQFAVVRESNAMIIVGIDATTTSVGAGAQELVVASPPNAPNSGAEAVAFDPGHDGRFWVMQEIDPMRVFRFARPADAQDHRFDGDLGVDEPFDPEQVLGVGDISDAVFDARTGHLLILSQEDHRVLEVAPEDGTVLATLELPASFGAMQAKWEGIALGPDDVLAVASEGLGAHANRAQLYELVP